MSTARRPLVLAASIVAIAMLGTGCSHSPANTGSSNPHGNTGTSSIHGQAVKFAECMRSNGVSGFPDPAATGSLTIDGVLNGSSLDPNSTAWRQALTACQHLEPPGFTGTTANTQQMKARLQFAQCVRDHGVTDFPDPTANGPLVDTNRIPSAATPAGMSALNAAMRACGRYAAASGVTGR
jgi:hypothetical protein